MSITIAMRVRTESKPYNPTEPHPSSFTLICDGSDLKTYTVNVNTKGAGEVDRGSYQESGRTVTLWLTDVRVGDLWKSAVVGTDQQCRFADPSTGFLKVHVVEWYLSCGNPRVELAFVAGLHVGESNGTPQLGEQVPSE